HVHQHPVAEDAGVVDHDVEAAELAQRGPHQPSGRLVVGDVVGVRDRVPAGRPDLLGDGLGGAGVGAGAVPGAPEVVDDDGGSLAGQLDGVGPAYSAGGAGDDGHAPPAQVVHSAVLPSRWGVRRWAVPQTTGQASPPAAAATRSCQWASAPYSSRHDHSRRVRRRRTCSWVVPIAPWTWWAAAAAAPAARPAPALAQATATSAAGPPVRKAAVAASAATSSSITSPASSARSC